MGSIIEYILVLPDDIIMTNVDDPTRRIFVNLYLETSPYASWEHLAGKLLVMEETTALEYAKKKIRHVRG